MDALALSCQFPEMDYYARWIFRLLLPLWFMLIFALIWLIRRALHGTAPWRYVFLFLSHAQASLLKAHDASLTPASVRDGGEAAEEDEVEMVAHDHTTPDAVDHSGLDSTMQKVYTARHPELILRQAVVVFFSAMYVALAKAATEFFDCTELPDGDRLLDASRSKLCFDDDWHRHLPLAVAAVIIYLFGIPMVFLVVMLRHRNAQHEPRFVASWGWLFVRFEPKYYFYSFFIAARKAAMVSSLVFFSDTAVSLGIATVVLVAALWAQAKKAPYASKAADGLAFSLILFEVILIACGWAFVLLDGVVTDALISLIGVGLIVAAVVMTFVAASRENAHHAVAPQ